MSHDLTGRWIICTVSTGEGCDLCFAALPLTEVFRTELRKGILGWRAAAEKLGNGYFDVRLSCGPAYWLDRLPDGVPDDFSEQLDRTDWVYLPLTPMEEMALLVAGTNGSPSREEVMKRLDDAVDFVTCRTEFERVIIHGEDRVCLSACERHSDVKAWSNSLPDWVLEWAMSGEEQ
jgi:hypothetical protein